jgi:lysozyme family protein
MCLVFQLFSFDLFKKEINKNWRLSDTNPENLTKSKKENKSIYLKKKNRNNVLYNLPLQKHWAILQTFS